MSNPTVAELATAATQQLATLTEEAARIFIRNNNIRSLGKLKTLVTELATKTADEITAACTPVEGLAQKAGGTSSEKPAPKKPATKPAATKAATGAKFERKGRAKRTAPVEAGPRGFRFGEVWNTSVIAGEGLALLEIHRPKLLAHAESVGVNANTIAAGDPVKIAKAIAAKLAAAAEAAE